MHFRTPKSLTSSLPCQRRRIKAAHQHWNNRQCRSWSGDSPHGCLPHIEASMRRRSTELPSTPFKLSTNLRIIITHTLIVLATQTASIIKAHSPFRWIRSRGSGFDTGNDACDSVTKSDWQLARESYILLPRLNDLQITTMAAMIWYGRKLKKGGRDWVNSCFQKVKSRGLILTQQNIYLLGFTSLHSRKSRLILLTAIDEKVFFSFWVFDAFTAFDDYRLHGIKPTSTDDLVGTQTIFGSPQDASSGIFVMNEVVHLASARAVKKLPSTLVLSVLNAHNLYRFYTGSRRISMSYL